MKLLKLCRFLSSLLVKLVQVSSPPPLSLSLKGYWSLLSTPQEFQEDSSEFAADVASLLIHLYG